MNKKQNDFTPKILTANHLLHGGSVFLASNGDWSISAKDAKIAHTSDDAGALMKEGAKASQDNIIIGEYLVDVAISNDNTKATTSFSSPVHIREKIRVNGPTVHPGLLQQWHQTIN